MFPKKIVWYGNLLGKHFRIGTTTQPWMLVVVALGYKYLCNFHSTRSVVYLNLIYFFYLKNRSIYEN